MDHVAERAPNALLGGRAGGGFAELRGARAPERPLIAPSAAQSGNRETRKLLHEH